MTPEEYVGRSNALSKELERVRTLLDAFAMKSDYYGINSDGKIKDRVIEDWKDVVRRIEALDEEFWSGK
ncbi:MULTISPECIES: hypothetical protein [Acetobacter]|uniref:Uncharacterized protein n=1 Tax=Acetobacter tropicalis TaxID=104102 RepID=A0A149U7E1_9PROT|nr:hypothetical protein [Acetobacter tropicalis]KXV61290.1 hypothetical protein AD947_00890 [Acetobacter tropicalis]